MLVIDFLLGEDPSKWLFNGCSQDVWFPNNPRGKKKIFFFFKIYKYVLDESESVVWFGDRLTGGVSGVTEMGAMFSLHLPRYMD